MRVVLGDSARHGDGYKITKSTKFFVRGVQQKTWTGLQDEKSLGVRTDDDSTAWAIYDAPSALKFKLVGPSRSFLHMYYDAATGHFMQIPVSSVEEIQSALNTLGYAVGPPDGKVGPGTRKAIAAFQSKQGLPVTSEVSTELLEQLKKAIGPK